MALFITRTWLGRQLKNWISTEPELLTDADLALFNERGIRSDASMISKRYAKAKKKYINDFDREKEI